MATKIFLHASDDKACTTYRAVTPMMQCFSELSNAGIHVTADKQTLPYEDFDIYIFNRLIRPEVTQKVINPLIRANKKFIWQCDDNIWRIPEWNPAFNLLDHKDLESTNSYMEKCERLWVSTKPLADFINQPNKTLVLPNLIDANNYDSEIKREDEGPIKIVWCGSCSHERDLDDIIEPIAYLSEKFGDKISIIFWGYLPTPLSDFYRQPGLPYATLIPKFKNLFLGEWFSTREYYHKLRQLKPDISIMPLNDCEFNKSKSNLKFLQTSMAGAACVATDLQPYDCIRDGETGLKVKPGDQQGWVDKISELIISKDLRTKINDAARHQILFEYSWQHSPSRKLWLDAFLELKHFHHS